MMKIKNTIYYLIVIILVSIGLIAFSQFLSKENWSLADSDSIVHLMKAQFGILDCATEISRCYVKGKECVDKVNKTVSKCGDDYNKAMARCEKYDSYKTKQAEKCAALQTRFESTYRGAGYQALLKPCEDSLTKCRTSAETYKEKKPDVYQNRLAKCQASYERCTANIERKKTAAQEKINSCNAKVQNYEKRAANCRTRAKEAKERCDDRFLRDLNYRIKQCDYDKESCLRRLKKYCPSIPSIF